MLDADDLERLRGGVRARTERDAELLDELRADVRDHVPRATVIRPAGRRKVPAIAIDGAETVIRLDPFSLHFVRVVDSLGGRPLLDVISPTMDTTLLSEAHTCAGDPVGTLMDALGVDSLHALSPMIPAGREQGSPAWVRAYLEVCEWAALYHRVCHTELAEDTLFVRGGLLRSKVFARELFVEIGERICRRVRALAPRRVQLVGIGRRSRVLTRYRLAIALEDALPAGRPSFVRVPRELEQKAYLHTEHARRPDDGETSTFTIGGLFLARLGGAPWDPICAVDLLHTQVGDASDVFARLLADAVEGFPSPGLPRCLQRARENAEPGELELEMLRRIVDGAVPNPRVGQGPRAFAAVG